jgi:hypothetical protein
MTLQEFTFTSNNHFVALEQHGFFSKSIYLVLITKNYLIGLELNKGISTESTKTLFTQKLPSTPTPRGSFQNPYSYIKEKFVKQIEKKYLYDQSIFALSKNNFRIDRNDIQAVNYDASQVKGFNYPNMGTLAIQAKASSKSHGFNMSKNIAEKSLIIMGDQDAKEILNSITTRSEEFTLA